MTANVEPDATPSAPPVAWWVLDRVLAVALSVLIGFVVAGVPLVLFGWFRPLTVALGVGAVTAIVMATRGRSPFLAPTPGSTLAALVLLIGVVTAWNVQHSSEHFATNRDPGVYATTALAVADEGDLLPTGEVGPFIDVPAIQAHGSGFYESPEDDEIYAQFAHLTTILHATAEWIGGLTLLTRLNALIAGVGMLAFFAFARLWLPPWIALAATTALGTTLPQIHVARDAFSEPVSQLLMIAGTLELTNAWRQRRADHAVVACLLLGGLVTARVDGLVLLVPIIVMAAATTIAHRSGDVDRRAATLGGIVAFGAAAGLGYIQLDQRSPIYLRDVWPQTRTMLLLSVAVAVVAAVGVLAWPALASIQAWFLERRRTIGGIGAAVVVVALQLMWFVRPQFEHRDEPGYPLVAGLQGVEGLSPDAARSYAEDTMVWLSWYVGPVTLALAIAGAGYVTWRVIAHGRAEWIPTLLLLGSTTAIYLWRPSIVPDQIWANRRFIPQTYPLIAMLAFVAVDAIRTRVRHGAAIAGLLAAAALLPILAVTIPLRATTTDYFTISDIEAACDSIGDDAAVVVLDQSGFGRILSNPLRFGCDVPTVYTAPDAEIDWAALATAWDDQGRRLRVIVPNGVEGAPGIEVGTMQVHEQRLIRTIERPPEGFFAFVANLQIREVRPG